MRRDVSQRRDDSRRDRPSSSRPLPTACQWASLSILQDTLLAEGRGGHSTRDMERDRVNRRRTCLGLSVAEDEA